MDKYYKVVEGLVIKEINSQYYAVPIGKLTNHFKGLILLNATSIYLWPFLIQGSSISDLVNQLTHKFDVDALQAKKDIDVLISSLDSHKLLNTYEL